MIFKLLSCLWMGGRKGTKKRKERVQDRFSEKTAGGGGTSFSLFVDNLPKEISKVKLESMFYRAGQIVDSFIPTDRRSGRSHGFPFVRFIAIA